MCIHEKKCALPAVDLTELKSGDEPIGGTDNPTGRTLLDFWRWSASDVLSNAPRGALAEFLVGHALGAIDSPSEVWASCDLKTPDGIRVEVKSAAYVQSWCQDKLSQIRFGIRRTLDEEWTKRDRHSDVYVFALLAEKDKEKIDPLDIGQWKFYVVATRELDQECGDQRTLGINGVRDLAKVEVPYAKLKAQVRAAASKRVANEGERKAKQ